MNYGEMQDSMASAIPTDDVLIAELRERLTEATVKCSERCLYQSAKWAAELLVALPEIPSDISHTTESQQSSFYPYNTRNDDPEELSLEARESSKYHLAKAYFDTKEYDRCAAVFLPPAIPAGGLAVFEKAKSRTPLNTPRKNKNKPRDHPQSPPINLSQKSLFLAIYARYLAGEKRKEEESEMVLGPNDGGQALNRELPGLVALLDAYLRDQDGVAVHSERSQGWLEYIYGVVLARSKQEDQAQEWLLRSVRLNPYHWGAWEELSNLLSSVDDLNSQLDSGLLKQNLMLLIYQVHAHIDLFSTTDSDTTVSSLATLLNLFPQSTFLRTQQALYYYHSKDFEAASAIFQDILVADPYRLDGLDHYSNILYVMGDRPKLAFLAHLATSIDKFRPETCCVVGNYYSMCSHHEKAVMYFRRALSLDRSFLSAWTLMGHEYIELKNTHAAIESYRRAVDVNRKDYRAWYGLGQAYEVLNMWFYALFYYQRAAGLRPYDAKMWQAVGSCYAEMNRVDQAIKALKRALAASTYYESENSGHSLGQHGIKSKGKHSKSQQKRKLLDPETLFQIAQLYERSEDEIEAARYMELCMAQETGQSVTNDQKSSKSANDSFSHKRARQRIGRDDDVDTDLLSSPGSEASNDTIPLSQADFAQREGDASNSLGTGTTATTSRARLWLARHAFKNHDLDLAERLAEELCMDGFEVEEAKGLVREIRGRRESTTERMPLAFTSDD